MDGPASSLSSPMSSQAMDTAAEQGPSRGSIPLYLVHGTATVWDAQVAATLHCTHGISGYRAGTLPGVSQQNAFLGLPLTLMREETAYLVASGIAHLVPVATAPELPCADDVAAHTAARVARVKASIDATRRANEQSSAQKQAAFQRGGDAARAKREARARARAEKLAAAATIDGATPSAPSPPAAPAKKEDPGYFHVVDALPSFPSLALGEPITSVPHPLFPFPSTPRDRALVATFRDLLDEKRHRVGLGPRFGGEYLVYPGDYLRYHAHFTSQVIVRDEPIRPMEIVGWGRLGTGTKKAGLLCCWDDESGEDKIEYYSLEWANFG